MTPDITWDNKEIDHLKPLRLFDISSNDELNEAFCLKNTQSLLKQYHQQKGTKLIFLDYQLQVSKAYQFIKLNDQEGLNEDLD